MTHPRPGPSPALQQQWAKTGKQEPRRYQCERCGGSGQQESGLYRLETRKYDSVAGVCEDCGGEGYLGFMS
jgi:DnaJ-class molecular chaperone